MSKRNLFDELMQGVGNMEEHRTGKITLRQSTVAKKPTPDISALEIRDLREKLHVSQAVFAQYIRTSPDTLRKWEQGKARPNVHAAMLIRLVERYPDMITRLDSV